MVTAQENLIYVLKNDPGDANLIDATKQKLKLLGLSEKMVEEISQAKKVRQTVPVFSNYDGHAHPVPKFSSGEMSGQNMSAGKINAERLAALSVKEGMYVMMGETVFDILDPNKIAVTLQIKTEDISKVKKDAEVEIEIKGNAEDKIKGKIDFIEPAFKSGLKTLTAKIYLDNKMNLPIGTLVKAKIKGSEMETLWIPLTALVDLGKDKIVFVKHNGEFAATKVETGTMTSGMVEISDGLTEEDDVAAEAHYLMDSETFVKTNSDEK